MVHSRWPAAFFLGLLATALAQHNHDHDHGGGAAGGDVSMPTASVVVSGDTVEITLAGPDTNWFGVAFGGRVMADAPYAIIVDGAHDVEEVTLSAHSVTDRHGGTGLTVISSESAGGTFTMVIERPLTGGHAGTVFADSSVIPIMLAAGTSETLEHHGTGRSSVSTIQVQSPSTTPSSSSDDGQGDPSHGDHSHPPSTSSAIGVPRRVATAIAIGLALANGLHSTLQRSFSKP